jgi:hypothetical protein
MLHNGDCLGDASYHASAAASSFRFVRIRGGRVAAVVLLSIMAAAFLVPGELFAQHGGGGGGGGRGAMGGGGGTGGGGRPGGVSEKDDLKDFHRVMALQATADQRAAFAKVAQYTQVASDQLHAFQESLHKEPASPPLTDRAAALDDAIAKARAGNQNFLASFSPTQKSGLKELTNKLAKADSELDKQIKALNQIVQTPKPENEQVVGGATNVDKQLTSFQSEQLALGGEMGILLSSDGQEFTFNLPKTTNAISIGGQSISESASEVVSRTSAENGRNIFSVKLVVDLSNVQQNLSAVLRSELNRFPRCGERIEIQEADLTPLAPASSVVTHLRYERWVCQPGSSPMEVSSGDATLEIKFTPAVEQSVDHVASLSLTSEITHVDATGFLRDTLRSGDLGVSLRDQIGAVLLSTLRKSADLKAGLPAVAQQSAVLQKAEFQDAGADQLNLLIAGQLDFSDEQAKQFATQLKEPLAARGPTTP